MDLHTFLRKAEEIKQNTCFRNIHSQLVLQSPSKTFKAEGRKEMFYLTTHSTHFVYGYMASDIWLRTFLIVRKETCCCHIGYSFRLTARVILYAPSHSLCYTSCGALAGTRNSYIQSTHIHIFKLILLRETLQIQYPNFLFLLSVILGGSSPSAQMS